MNRTLTDEQKELFLHTYGELRNDETLTESKTSIIILQLGLSCLIRIINLEKSLMMFSEEEKLERYGRTKEIVTKLKEILK